MKLKKLENRQQWVLTIDGHKYVRTAIDWFDESPISISWHLSEDAKRGVAYLTTDKLEALFLENNCKLNLPVEDELITAKSEDSTTLSFNKEGSLILGEVEKSKLTFGLYSDNKADEIIEFIDRLTSIDINLYGLSYFNRMANMLIERIILPTVSSEADYVYWEEVNAKLNNKLNNKKMENDSKAIDKSLVLTEQGINNEQKQSQLKITALQFASNSSISNPNGDVEGFIKNATKIYDFIK